MSESEKKYYPIELIARFAFARATEILRNQRRRWLIAAEIAERWHFGQTIVEHYHDPEFDKILQDAGFFVFRNAFYPNETVRIEW